MLQLVTLPNLLIAALPFLAPETELCPGHLDITDEIKESFKSLLQQQGIELEFSYGHWAGLSKEIEGFDLVLTAETIYAEESVNDLLSVLRAASKPTETPKLENGMDNMSIKDEWTKDIEKETVVLIAAKVSTFPTDLSLISGIILWGRRRIICIPTPRTGERRLVYMYQRVDTGSR